MQTEVTDEDEFLAIRPLLFSIAYEMTGSVADAEDILSEAYLRLRRSREHGTKIRSLRNYLSTVVSRLALDQLQSARSRREVYVGPWLPEPLVEEASSGGFEQVERSDTVSMAFLVLLESLNPVERAVFVLREVFSFDYPQIAEIVGRSEANCRQLLRRARQHVEHRQPRFDADPADRDALARRFFAALARGDLGPLVDRLAEDVVAYGDGGGSWPSIPRPILGRENVVRMLTGMARSGFGAGLRLHRVTVNGQPGALVRTADGRLLNVIGLDIVNGQIVAVRSVINPDKLGHLAPLVPWDDPLRGNGRRVDPG
ncbi:RNA polymerase sigma-70 factor [Microlunatus sp. Gsoil 973]|uniref:RNA polymerase sigma-70 factor n=1 Tax=Microlunatus sp. Gsoil 973 TaxID=2672569 RepID=UPI0012B485AE|nr:RNA polymerase sigma-70 factor [Microlunatus sp. Gsoil 973]QGN34580.1 RNA polymerase sigma-70 factor [Microlunatus sp. Gsoil 973]